MKKAIPYYRVSTERQGHSGLGLEAQQKAVREYAGINNLELLHEFTEIESGRKNKRPLLQQALIHCKKEDAILLIAKIDRLARNVAFVSNLLESDVEFKAVDMPEAGKFVVHIMAAVAEMEADMTSVRTKEALRAAKLRGVQLGKYGTDILSKKNKKASEDFAVKMKPIIERLKDEGYKTVRALAQILNARKILPFNGKGGRWHPTTVYNLLGKIEVLSQAAFMDEAQIINQS
jgi:DNA invertase Pin-like site-specific DNA recombinase